MARGRVEPEPGDRLLLLVGPAGDEGGLPEPRGRADEDDVWAAGASEQSDQARPKQVIRGDLRRA